MLSVQELVYIDAYLQYGVPVEAARLAGYADPAAQGQELRRRLAKVIQAEADWREANAIMTPREVLARLSLWARNGGEGGSPVAVKAAELVGKATGAITDKLDIRIDKSNLIAEAQSALSGDVTKLLKAASSADSSEFDADVDDPTNT